MEWTGSEKQIRWAQDIKAALLPEIEALAEMHQLTDEQLAYLDGGRGMARINEFDARAAQYGSSYAAIARRNADEQYMARFAAAVDAIRNCTNAKWWIDCGRSTANYAIMCASGVEYRPGYRLI